MVRRVLAADEKPLHWVGSSKRDFLSFPAAVKEEHGAMLSVSRSSAVKRDVDLVAERLKTAERDHEEHYGKSKR